MIAARSPIVKLGVRATIPMAVAVSIYLLFAGHNAPGGGFAAGLVLGAAITLRSVADVRQPRRATPFVAAGVIVVVAVALLPLLVGDTLLDQYVVSAELPVLGKVKSGSALLFDVGVTAVVVGLVQALLTGLAADSADPLDSMTGPR